MKLIDKDDLVAEINKRIKECDKLADAAADNNLHSALEANELLIRQYTSLLNFLDTLEVKEVNLEKEIKDYLDNQPIITRSKGVDFKLVPSPETIAKHFFELGIMMKK